MLAEKFNTYQLFLIISELFNKRQKSNLKGIIAMSVDQQKISELLFELDPMMTCCKENDCFDEYDMVSKFISDDVNNGINLIDATKSAFLDFFDEDISVRMNLDEFALLIKQKKIFNHGERIIK